MIGLRTLPAQELLALMRLSAEELEASCGETRIAVAIRAELWHGSLAGARTQAALGAANLLSRAAPWKSPALLYLGAGREALRTCAESEEAAMLTHCDQLFRFAIWAVAREPFLAAGWLLGLADILGPISAVHPGPRVLTAIERVRSLCDELSRRLQPESGFARAPRDASRRLAGWRGPWPDADSTALLDAYDRLPPPGTQLWVECPRLELLMALSEAARGGHQFNAEMSSLPPSLTTAPWPWT